MALGDNGRLKIVQEKDRLSIEFFWFNPMEVLVHFLGIAAFLYLSSTFNWSGGTIITIIGFLIKVVFLQGTALVLSYRVLCCLFNETVIEIAEDFLTIKHHPIPWWKGNITIPIIEIDQLFVEEIRGSGGDIGTTYFYSLGARKTNNTYVTLLHQGLLEKKEAIKVEQLIEKFLGIDDAPIIGEYKE